MAVDIIMLTNAASPEKIMLAGKAYRVSNEEAQRLLDPPAHVIREAGPDGKVIEHKITVGPFAKRAPGGTKLERLPPQPDPLDVPEEVPLFEDEEDLEAE